MQISYLRVPWRSTHAADAAEIRKLTSTRQLFLLETALNIHQNGFVRLRNHIRSKKVSGLS